MSLLDEDFLKMAINKAYESVEKGGFPAGAVVVKDKEVIGEGISIGNILNDPSSHGEMAAIRQACSSLAAADLSGSILYASMQPCLMCFGAAMWGGISRIVYACSQGKVCPEYYGGHYHLQQINTELLRPVELVHRSEFENEALKVVRKWENGLS